MNSIIKYFKGLFGGIKSLLIGMSVTWKELWTKKVTNQYPENRDTLVISDRFRAELVMPHDANNEHACTACGICQMNCPNGTIQVISKMIDLEDGKKKKIIDKYVWDLGMCTFCNLCVITCPSDAIKFENTFENAVFTRSKLIQTLNHEGSKLREKKKEVKPVEPKAAPVVEVKVVATPEVKSEPVVKVASPVELLVKAVAETKTEKAVEPITEPVVEEKVPEVIVVEPIIEEKSPKAVELLVEAVAEAKTVKVVEPIVEEKAPEVVIVEPVIEVKAPKAVELLVEAVAEAKTVKPAPVKKVITEK